MPENVTPARRASDNASIHEITVRSRKQMKISGVKEVLSFDPSFVELQTVCGELTVDGVGLKMGTLDTKDGIVELEGTVIAITYSDGDGERTKKRNPLKRLLG